MTPPLKINDDVKEAVRLEAALSDLDHPRVDAGHHVQTLLNARLKEKDERQARLDSAIELLRSTPFIEVMETIARIEKERDQLKQQLLLANDAAAKGEAGRNMGTAYEECRKELLTHSMTIESMRQGLKRLLSLCGGHNTKECDEPQCAICAGKKALTTPPSETLSRIIDVLSASAGQLRALIHDHSDEVKASVETTLEKIYKITDELSTETEAKL